MKVWFQVKLCEARDARVSVLDHGFLYGDGIYETVHAYDYHVFHWDSHYQRLLNSARRIALSIPWSSRTLRERVVKVLRANREPNTSVRITIARGPGPIGLNPAVCPRPTLVMLPLPYRDVTPIWKRGITIGITAIRRNHPLCLDPQIKSNNSLNTILARIEAEKMRVFEGVLTNLDGYLTEGTISNVFFVKNENLYTPALVCGLLEGVTRGALIQLAKRAGIRVREGRYTPRDLLRSDEAFLSNTTLEVAPIVAVKFAGSRKVHRIGPGRPGRLTRLVHALFRASVDRERS